MLSGPTLDPADVGSGAHIIVEPQVKEPSTGPSSSQPIHTEMRKDAEDSQAHDNIEVANEGDLENSQSLSWNTREWTFQEEILEGEGRFESYEADDRFQEHEIPETFRPEHLRTISISPKPFGTMNLDWIGVPVENREWDLETWDAWDE